MTYAIEREYAGAKITFAQFCESYAPIDHARLRDLADDDQRFVHPEFAGFATRTFVPDGRGIYGEGRDDAQARWCEPHEWHRLYYENRKRVSPGMFE